jgi:hypothetical protein
VLKFIPVHSTRIPSLLLAVMLCAATAACGYRSIPGGNPSSASSTDSPATAQAQQVVDNTLAAQPAGAASAAAYVETTFSKYLATIPAQFRQPSPIASPTDKVLVIKIFGAFADPAGLAGGSMPKPTTFLVIYDETLGRGIEATSFAAPETPDISSNAPSSSGAIYADLRLLGTPNALQP